MSESSSDDAPAPRTSRDAAEAPPGSRPDWTVSELLQWTTERFESAGIEGSRVDAEHLLAHALGCSRMDLYVQHHRLLGAEERKPFREMVQRRLRREPVAYILGRRGFHALDLELLVDPRVLVPRPETEHLVDWLLEDLRPPPAPPMAILDVGTGSGAIGLAIKRARPELEVFAVDTSDDALAVARENARRLDIDVQFGRGDARGGLASLGRSFTAVAANLPYIADAEFEALSPEVREHEPRAALAGGPDGLDLVRALIDQCADDSIVTPGGALYLEVGLGQAGPVMESLTRRGFVDVETRLDHGGVRRVVRGRISRES